MGAERTAGRVAASQIAAASAAWRWTRRLTRNRGDDGFSSRFGFCAPFRTGQCPQLRLELGLALRRRRG